MSRRLLFALLMVATCASLTACDRTDYIQSHTVDDRLILTNHWSTWAVFLTIGIVLLGLGLPMLTGRLKFKGKPRALGAILTVLGLAFSVGTVLSEPYTYVAIDRQELYIQGQLFGSTKISVDLTNTKAIDIYKVRRRSRSGRRGRGGSRLVTRVRFIPHEGKPRVIGMEGDLREAALMRLMQMAPELGIHVTDRRDQGNKGGATKVSGTNGTVVF